MKLIKFISIVLLLITIGCATKKNIKTTTNQTNDINTSIVVKDSISNKLHIANTTSLIDTTKQIEYVIIMSQPDSLGKQYIASIKYKNTNFGMSLINNYVKDTTTNKSFTAKQNYIDKSFTNTVVKDSKKSSFDKKIIISISIILIIIIVLLYFLIKKYL